MTMADTEVQASKPAGDGQRTVTKIGLSNGQEVNKAKDPADGGGSLPQPDQKADEKCATATNHVQPNEQIQQPTSLRRGISFPKDTFVSGYCDPPDPWKGAPKWTRFDILSAYRGSCEKHSVKPLNKVIQQIEVFNCNGKREEKLVIKNEKLDTKQCEPFEEILRRVQFKHIDLESCNLDDETAVAWFDMIEYYESTCHLNISFNKNIGVRGWQACSRLIRRTPCLTTLDLRNCDMNDRSIPLFGRALKLGSHLTVLHMENMYLSGRSLIILVAALKMNEVLQELFLADNRLMPSDGIQLGTLLKYNHSLTLLDLRNNHLQDVGVGHVCDGLYEQNLDKGLRTLVMWNNQITYQAMGHLSRALGSTKCLETLNLGHNNVTNEGIHVLKEGLLKSKSLMRLGLQSTRLTCEGAVALAEYVADSLSLLRLDLRENDIKTAGLMALSLALKVNESVTRVDIDKETKKDSGMKDYADQQRRLQQDMRDYLERNQRQILEREERERQALEERAQVEMTARASVQSAISSAQAAIEAHPEMLLTAESPEPAKQRRPSLLFDMHRLTPQESLESPHCADVHFFTPKVGEAPVVLPEVNVTSPPHTLNLKNPLTSPPPVGGGPCSSGGGGEGGLSMPLPSALVTALRSPPPELLLSPQYYPKPTARKIFSVSRVVEGHPASPSVSKAGVLDPGATGESHTPAVRLSVSVAGGGATRPSPVSPTLLCQDLSTQTVNVFLQQIVSEGGGASTLSAEGEGGEEGEGLSDAAHRQVMDMLLMAGAGDPNLKVNSTRGGGQEGSQGGERGRDAMEGGGSKDSVRDAMEGGAGGIPQNAAPQEEEGGGEDLDPLGVLQAPPSASPPSAGLGEGGLDCDSAGGGSEPSGLEGEGGGQAVTGSSATEGSSGGGDGDGGKPDDSDSSVLAAVVASSQNIPDSTFSVEDDSSDEDLFSSSSSLNPSVPDKEEEKVSSSTAGSNSPTVASGEDRVEGQSVLPATGEGESVPCALTAEEDASKAEGGLEATPSKPEEKLTTQPEENPVEENPAIQAELAQQQPTESPLFKTVEFTNFDMDTEDLALFGAGSNKTDQGQTAPTSSPANSSSSLVAMTAGGGGGESRKGAESSSLAAETGGVKSGDVPERREVSPGPGDTWLAVDASSLGGEGGKGEGSGSEGKQPDFFTALSLNGLTQELASALSSIDDNAVGDAVATAVHNPDDFERELDAMLASVKTDLPWPLQQTPTAEKISPTALEVADAQEQQSTA